MLLSCIGTHSLVATQALACVFTRPQSPVDTAEAIHRRRRDLCSASAISARRGRNRRHSITAATKCRPGWTPHSCCNGVAIKLRQTQSYINLFHSVAIPRSKRLTLNLDGALSALEVFQNGPVHSRSLQKQLARIPPPHYTFPVNFRAYAYWFSFWYPLKTGRGANL
jgi:hypothetical protein